MYEEILLGKIKYIYEPIWFNSTPHGTYTEHKLQPQRCLRKFRPQLWEPPTLYQSMEPIVKPEFITGTIYQRSHPSVGPTPSPLSIPPRLSTSTLSSPIEKKYMGAEGFQSTLSSP
ncbi:unnamed protein product [Allacma fusca]|uniref:Uncharacterized protein n=1 Tax=Allacma fusca TaxID=39272 RepID=A0A8J2K2J9_9HEXA|nr:unnamed protein product [Allacma fusca]